MAEVGVLNLTIKDNSEKAGQGLSSLAGALTAVKTAMEGFSLTPVGDEIKQLAKVIHEGRAATLVKNLGTMFNAINQFSKVKGFSMNAEEIRDYAKNLNYVADAVERTENLTRKSASDQNYWDSMVGASSAKKTVDELKVATDSYEEQMNRMIDIAKKSGGDVMSRLAASGFAGTSPGKKDVPGQIKMDLDGLLEKTQSVTEEVTKDYKDMVGVIEQTPLDFSKFDPSNLPYSSLGMTIEQYRNGAMEATRFCEAVKDAETTVLSMKAKADAARFDANETKAIIVYQENMEDSWQNICNRMSEANRELEEYCEGQKQVIFGNESIQHLWEDNRIGPTLQGVFGDEAQAAMLQQISDVTGLSIENLAEQIYQLSNGFTDLRHTAEATANGGLEEFRQEIDEITNATTPAMSKIELLRAKADHLWRRVAELSEQPRTDEFGFDNGVTNSINNYLLRIGQVNEQIDKLIHKAHEAQQAMQFDTMKNAAADQLAQRTPWTAEDVSNIVNYYTEIELLTMKMDAQKQALADDINQGQADTAQIVTRAIAIQELKNKIDELTKSQKENSSVAHHASTAWGAFKKGVESMFPTITRLIKQFKGTMISRSIRYAIRTIASGFREGVENVYNYSKAVGTSFAPAMDQAATSLQQMKNSLGASLAPVIQALIPVLQNVVNWFINLVNYANQFFSLLNGQKAWTRALPATTTAFNKQEKAAKSAGAAIKDLLADWDELNIIQSNTSGAGSGAGTSTAEDYLKMFEEVNTFDKKIRDVVDFIKNNFEKVLSIVEGIGAAILLWKISNAFGNSLNLLQKLELAAGLTLVIESIKMAASAGYDIGVNGLNETNAMEAVGSVVEGMLGGGLVGLAFGGVVGGLIGLAAGAVLSLIVLHANIKRGKLDSLYGNLHQEVDEIVKELEEGILSPETKLQIEVIDASLKSIEEAETKVSGAINDLSKEYPVGVTITPDNAKDFKTKVEALVAETNTLISASKDMLSVTVPATAAFTPTFVNDAWDNVGEYVTELGKKIGEELDKSITDNTKLDDLKEKLLNISRAVLTATRSSELVSEIGVAGAATRENSRLGKYDRETVANYIEQYGLLMQEKMGEATGYAQAEFIEKNRLAASLEESIAGYLDLINQGGLTEEELAKYQSEIADMTNQLEVVKNEIQEKFGVNGEKIASVAQAYYDEWTLTGRTMYANDIVGALTTAMSKNTDNGQLEQRLIGAGSEATFNANMRDADKYIWYMYRSLADTIGSAAGMKTDDLMTFFETSGVNPLTLFDQSFVEQYQEKIISWLGKSDVNESDKAKILAAFGLDFDDQIKERLAKVELGNLISGKGRNETFDIITEWLNNSPLSEEIKENVLAALGFNKKSIESTTKTYDGYLFDDSDINDLYKHINWSIADAGYEGDNRSKFQNAVNELLANGSLEIMQDLLEYINKYGVENAFDRLDNYLKGNDWTLGRNSAERFTGRGMGVSDTGFTNKYDTNPSDPYASGGLIQIMQQFAETANKNADEADMSKAVASGTASANREQNELINDAIRILRQILAKQTIVNIAPTASLGLMNGAAAVMASKVTGG